MLFNGHLTRVSADDCSRIVSQLRVQVIARIHATRCLLHVTRSQFPSRFVGANSSRGTKISSFVRNINDKENFHQVSLFDDGTKLSR